jgi:hypothetical protein
MATARQELILEDSHAKVLLTEAGSEAGASIQLQPGVHRIELDKLGAVITCDGQGEWGCTGANDVAA